MVDKHDVYDWTEEIMDAIYDILKRGNDVEIKGAKDGYKVLEVERKRALTITKENRKG